MANALYDLGRKAFLDADIDILVDTIKVALVKSTYTPTLASNQYYDPAINTHVHGTPQTIGNKTTTAGVFDGDDVTFTAVAGGATINYLVIYQDTGTPGTSRLIACIDTATGIPLSTNGGDITIQWDNGANKIFKL
jgi:hypothetical protein